MDIDGNSSLKDDGFEIVQDFAANVSSKYQAEYYGHYDMRIGIALFCVGKLNAQEDGTTTIEDAKYVMSLMSNIESVRQQLKTLELQEGFTNTAPGLARGRRHVWTDRSPRRDECDCGYYGRHVSMKYPLNPCQVPCDVLKTNTVSSREPTSCSSWTCPS